MNDSAENVANTRTLIFGGAQRVRFAAAARAKAVGQPMCVSVVDAGGNLLASGCMDGAKALSVIPPENVPRGAEDSGLVRGMPRSAAVVAACPPQP